MTESPHLKVEALPIELVKVPNPRARNKQKFKPIVENIERVGLKRPITVTRRTRKGRPYYELVCGQGRLDAFKLLGQEKVPAIVIDASRTESLVMSLVENCARRQRSHPELLRDIAALKARGYSEADIGRKTGLSTDYVHGISTLLEKGEDRLLSAVECGTVPLSVAVEIADTEDPNAQEALQRAYESKQLRGRKLLEVKRLLRRRQRQGKLVYPKTAKSREAASMLRAYRNEVAKKQALVDRANITRDALTFVANALAVLTADEYFLTLLRAENLEDMPARLAERVTRARAA